MAEAAGHRAVQRTSCMLRSIAAAVWRIDRRLALATERTAFARRREYCSWPASRFGRSDPGTFAAHTSEVGAVPSFHRLRTMSSFGCG
jgi:hypothetical protein